MIHPNARQTYAPGEHSRLDNRNPLATRHHGVRVADDGDRDNDSEAQYENIGDQLQSSEGRELAIHS